MSEEAKQARLLAFYNCLTNTDKGLVLKILEVIQKGINVSTRIVLTMTLALKIQILIIL